MAKLKHLSHVFSKIGQSPVSPRSKTGHRLSTEDREAKGLYQHDTFDFLSLIKSWSLIVGPMLAANTVPLRIRHGNLVVLTKHSAFNHQLSFMNETILEKIFQRFPLLKKSIQGIQYQTSPGFFREENLKPHPLSPEALFNKNRSKSHPFSPSFRRLKKSAEDLFEGIEFQDNELRNIFISLYIQKSDDLP